MHALFATLSIMSGVASIACLTGAFAVGSEALDELDPVAGVVTFVLFVLFGVFMWGSFILYPEPR